MSEYLRNSVVQLLIPSSQELATGVRGNQAERGEQAHVGIGRPELEQADHCRPAMGSRHVAPAIDERLVQPGPRQLTVCRDDVGDDLFA